VSPAGSASDVRQQEAETRRLALVLVSLTAATAAFAQIPSDLRAESRGVDSNGRFMLVPSVIRNPSRTGFAEVEVACTLMDPSNRLPRMGRQAVRNVPPASTAYGAVQFDNSRPR
jgi:hypothetical protein